MKAISFRRHAKNTLIRFFDLELTSGLVLRGCTRHLSYGRHWVGLPARSYKDANSDNTWAAIIDFRDKSVRDNFQRQAAVAALAAARAAEAAA
jgi:hypothetical protein